MTGVFMGINVAIGYTLMKQFKTSNKYVNRLDKLILKCFKNISYPIDTLTY